MQRTCIVLTACGRKAPENKPETAAQTKIPDEFTSEKQIPSVLENELTPEEKAAVLNQIMPAFGKRADPGGKISQVKKDAEAGDAKAQNGLGVMYYTGEAISKDASGKTLSNDPEKAAAWFHRSAAQGYADCAIQSWLIVCEWRGRSQGSGQGRRVVQKAADQGNTDAQNNLGVMYYSGEGVPRDAAKATEWFKKAAAQGNADAQANLDAMK